MAEGDGGISTRCFLEKDVGDRFADDVASADDDYFCSLNLGAGAD